MAFSIAPWANPTAWAAIVGRPASRAAMAIRNPFPSSPNKFSFGTGQSWKRISDVGAPRIPIFDSTFPTINFETSFSTIKALIPRVPFEGSVIAKTTMVVFAMTDPSKGTRGISAFIVEKEVSKFMVGKVESKMGIRGAPTSEILFHDCPVPKENLLGEEGKGFRIAMAALDAGRPTIAAQAVGLAQGAMEKAIRYSKERIQFGKPISEFQGIQWMFADMACQIEAARALTYQTCNLVDQNDPQKTYLSACFKLFATDLAMKVTTDAPQIAGGYGYMTDFH